MWEEESSSQNLWLIGTRRTKTTRAALGGREFLHFSELRLHHGNDHQLRYALQGLQRKGGFAPVPERNHQFALVVGVNEPDEIAQHNAFLSAHAAARQDDGSVVGVAHVDGQARMRQIRLPGLNRDGGVQEHPEIQSC